MSARALLSNVMAGAVMGVINVSAAVSIAALMFSGTKPEYFAAGVAILLIGTVVSGLGGALASGYPGTIISPRSGTAPLFAGLVAAVIAMMQPGAPGDAVLATIIVTLMLTAFVSGLVMLLLGQLKLGRLVRFVPYPVMAGFFAGIGFLCLKGGISVAGGEALSVGSLGDYLSGDPGLKALPSLVFAMALYGMWLRWGHWALVPLFLAVGVGGFYAVLGVTNGTLAGAQAAGWLPTIAAMSVDVPVLKLFSLPAVDWSVVAAQSGGVSVAAILIAIMVLVDASGIELVASRELKPDRELRVAGLANMVNGLVGGYPGVHAANNTAFVHTLGGDSRLMGFTYAGVAGFALVAGTGFIGHIPTFILGGLLIYAGLHFLIDWAWKSRSFLPLLDYVVILLIFVVVVAVGVLEGFAFGFALTVVLFVITYSRLKVIRSDLTGREHASYVERDPARRQILNEQGHRIWILTLQGFIFFGTAEGLLSTIKERVSRRPSDDRIRYVVLDFRNVGQLDASAVHVFSKLAQVAAHHRAHLIVTEISDAIRSQLTRTGFFTDAPPTSRRLEFGQLDEGVAWCEERILASVTFEAKECRDDAEGRLTELLGDPTAAHQIAGFFEPVAVTAGDTLFRQGESGDCLYVVHSGVASVIMETPNGHERVIRIFAEGAILGEMALYTRAPRSASVRIEESGVFYRLGATDLVTMQKQYPQAVGLFHAFVVRLLAEKLDRATKEIRHSA